MNDTLSKVVYDFILEEIRQQRWKTGDKIYSEMKLCEELSVSRIAVREALEQCVALGVLEKKKGSGTYVAEINLLNILENVVPLMNLQPMDLMDVLKFRLQFEPGNVIEFINNCNEQHIQELIECHEKMVKLADQPEFYSEDYKFHGIIAKGTNNPIVVSINTLLIGVLETSQSMTNLKIGSEIGLRYHGRILEAIINKDVEIASLLMKRHIEETIDALEI